MKETSCCSFFFLSRYYGLSTASIYLHGANLLPKVKTYGELPNFLYKVAKLDFACESLLLLNLGIVTMTDSLVGLIGFITHPQARIEKFLSGLMTFLDS